jgi:hypothetical protein
LLGGSKQAAEPVLPAPVRGFFGTFAPERFASESPIAMAAFAVTFLPIGPIEAPASVPMASNSDEAFFPYRAMRPPP